MGGRLRTGGRGGGYRRHGGEHDATSSTEVNNNISKSDLGAVNSEATDSSSNELPLQFRDCVSDDQRMGWLHSERGQSILNQRPGILKAYNSGRIQMMMKNPEKLQMLNKRLVISGTVGQNQHQHGHGYTSQTGPRAGNGPRAHDNKFIRDLFTGYPRYLAYREFPRAKKEELRDRGLTVFQGVVDEVLIDMAIAAVHSEVGESGAREGSNHEHILALYYASPIYSLVEDILHNEKVGICLQQRHSG